MTGATEHQPLQAAYNRLTKAVEEEGINIGVNDLRLYLAALDYMDDHDARTGDRGNNVLPYFFEGNLLPEEVRESKELTFEFVMNLGAEILKAYTDGDRVAESIVELHGVRAALSYFDIHPVPGIGSVEDAIESAEWQAAYDEQQTTGTNNITDTLVELDESFARMEAATVTKV